jgi:hypothetical protein
MLPPGFPRLPRHALSGRKSPSRFSFPMHIVKAVSFKVASTLMFAIMGAQVRYLAGAYPEGQVAFFRSLFALIPILIVFGWRGQLKGALRTERPEGTSAARRLQRGRDLCDLRSAGADPDRGFHRHCVRIAADHRDLRRRFLKEKVTPIAGRPSLSVSAA